MCTDSSRGTERLITSALFIWDIWAGKAIILEELWLDLSPRDHYAPTCRAGSGTASHLRFRWKKLKMRAVKILHPAKAQESCKYSGK